MKRQYRQGDVLLEETDEMPMVKTMFTPSWSYMGIGTREIDSPLKLQRGKRIVLAEGEVTGHAHAMDIKDADWWKNGDTQVVDVLKEKALVKHEEHNPLEIPKGKYKVIRQREYQPDMGQRRVED